MGASHFGGFCSGFDIDMRVLKGSMHAGVRTGATVSADPPPSGLSEEGGAREKRKKKKKKSTDIQRSIWENFRWELIVLLIGPGG